MKISKEFHQTKDGIVKHNPLRPSYHFDREYWVGRKDRKEKLGEYIKRIKQKILQLIKYIEQADYAFRVQFRNDLRSRAYYKKEIDKRYKDLLMNQRLLEKAEDTYMWGYD